MLTVGVSRHYDYFFHEGGTSNGGNRYATVLMYLADTEEGGETTFPNVPAPNGINEVRTATPQCLSLMSAESLPPPPVSLPSQAGGPHL
jgi:hypothetical protein